MALCAYIMHVGRMIVGTNGDLATLRCSAETVAGSAYCPVHDAMARGVVHGPRRRVRRSLEDDVLPWSGDDRRVFKTPRKLKS